MIVPMRHLTLLCVAGESRKTLEVLRDLGCVHLDLSSASSQKVDEARAGLEDAGRAVRILRKAAKETHSAAARREACADAPDFDAVRGADLPAAVLAADAKRRELAAEADALRRTVREYAPFGDFDPALAESVRAAGVPVALARSAGSPPECRAFVGEEVPEGWTVVPMPKERLSATVARLDATEGRIAAIGAALAGAAARASAIEDCRPGLKDRLDFAEAEALLSAQGEVAYVEGWIPAESVPRLRAKAVTNAWGLLVREAEADEEPPVLIRPPKFFRPVAALFHGLGIAPAYRETDVSVPFMCYFAVFFAMLVGDGGYGAIMLALALWGWRKTKPKEPGTHRPRIVRSWLALLTVFSLGTVAWGLLSNSWFGAQIPWCAGWPTVEWLGDPSYNNMMFLCFTIGASHLILARLWNGACALNSLDCLPEFGWAGVLLFMYFVVNAIVGISAGIPHWSYWMFGASLALIVSRTRGVALGMLPLNVMSSMGDIISYVRLFAVGYASLKVAENFNGMAVGLDLPLWAKIVPMALILLVGHGINFMLAGLAVLVHAVRLNTLEFSTHKGLTWSGLEFRPFRRNRR